MSIGYYNTWDEAFDVCKQYMSDFGSGHYKVDQCMCGKYYFWVEKD